ncbi:MAG: 1-acyl-sn-glycerol-3-phosphate acyltransferase [Defluviitaleaceae bacterium]|nr:1-acyl-sn-glycerol-3-phosphate acyltransferase [Defluviitaleaceae bacterium]MCL2274938.1 1-acyl-sn-glycerol-3-phosphate acyltransferase [Defluviitaleaceae bacterium]
MLPTEPQRLRPPTLPPRQRLTVSDEELTDFYLKLREYYINLDFDNERVAKEQKYYRGIANASILFSRLKRTVVLHKEKIKLDTPMIYTANHIGSFDHFYVPSLVGNIPLHYLVKDKVTQWPIRWNLIYKPTGVVVVDISNFRSWTYAKAKLIQYLLHGRNIFIFAEGSRRGENNMGEFNPGIAQIAQDTDTKVQTLAIKNVQKLFMKRPIICAGEVITVEPREDVRNATARIREGVVNAYNEILKYEESL